MKSLRDLNLNALRIAESAARTGSFVRAAEEQNLTASAVSHRIKALEKQLGVVLFERHNNSVALTPQGRDFIDMVRQGFATIVAAKKSVLVQSPHRTLKLRALPTFTMRWLVHRLPDFQRRSPDIRLDISTSYDLPDFVAEDVDLAICYGNGHFPGWHKSLLFREDLIAVCSPGLLAAMGKRADELDVSDLRHFTLLHSETCTPNWRSWLEFASARGVLDKANSIQFDSCMLTYDAAVAGLGFACANRAYVAHDLRSGRLVAPFRLKHPNRNGWYVVRPDESSPSRPAEIFERWILAAASKPGAAAEPPGQHRTPDAVDQGTPARASTA